MAGLMNIYMCDPKNVYYETYRMGYDESSHEDDNLF